MATVIILIDRRTDCGPTSADETIRQNGFHVMSASDGEQAVALASEFHAAVIVLRTCGPTTETFHACRLLRTHPATRTIPVLVITRVDDLYVRDQLVRAGATAILVEPPRPALLLRQIRRLTGRYGIHGRPAAGDDLSSPSQA